MSRPALLIGLVALLAACVPVAPPAELPGGGRFVLSVLDAPGPLEAGAAAPGTVSTGTPAPPAAIAAPTASPTASPSPSPSPTPTPRRRGGSGGSGPTPGPGLEIAPVDGGFADPEAVEAGVVGP